MMEEKLFTLEETNTLIPKLKEMLQELSYRKRVLSLALNKLMKIKEKARHNGHNPMREELLEKISAFNMYLQEIYKLGCILRDIDLGLVDFPAIINDKKALLCWQMDEDRVTLWHEINEPCVNRKPL